MLIGVMAVFLVGVSAGTLEAQTGGLIEGSEVDLPGGAGVDLPDADGGGSVTCQAAAGSTFRAAAGGGGSDVPFPVVEGSTCPAARSRRRHRAPPTDTPSSEPPVTDTEDDDGSGRDRRHVRSRRRAGGRLANRARPRPSARGTSRGHTGGISDATPLPAPIRRARRHPHRREPELDGRRLRPRSDRGAQLRHRPVHDPAVPASDLPGLRNPVRDPLAGAGLDQPDRDRLRHQPQRLHRRRPGLDAVHPLDLGDVRGRRKRGRAQGPLQPRRRDLRRGALPEGRRRGSRTCAPRSSPTTTPTGTSTRSCSTRTSTASFPTIWSARSPA